MTRTSERWTPLAWANYLRSRRQVHKLFRAGAVLERLAAATWEISPPTTSTTRAAYCLPGQLKRVTGMAYTNNPERDMAGGLERVQASTRGFLLKDVWLLDGSLYKHVGRPGIVRLDLHSRSRLPWMAKYLPRLRAEIEIDRGAIYSSYDGNEFFGLWLTDDCTTYELARNEGVPVSACRPVTSHMPVYEKWLGMQPLRSDASFLKELVLFDDNWENNAGKRVRLLAAQEKLLSRVTPTPHPGVFLLRRNSGVARVLHNEMELALHLQDRRGFRIVDVTRDDVPTIVSKCAGARVVVGVEGSQLMHAVMVLRPGGAVLTLQPPNRFSGVIKRTTDMAGQDYGFVVGVPRESGYWVDPSEVERTLDLFPLQGAEQ